jgi:hypothetical protein
VVELVLAEPSLEERPGVDARGRVALVEDLVARLAVVLAPEEVVEADLVQACRRGVGREVAADPGELAVRPQDHGGRVPADQPPDPPLDLLVAREERLLLGADRVDVAGLGERRQPDLELACALQQLVDEEPGTGFAGLLDDLVEGFHPILGFVRVDVRQLVLELIEVHGIRTAPRGVVWVTS